MHPPSLPPTPDSGRAERALENILWQSRLIFVIAVLGCLILAGALLWVSALDAIHTVQLAGHYADPALSMVARKATRIEVVSEAVKSLDGFLLAMALLIVAFGIYELFVSELTEVHAHSQAGRILVIRSLDDLKSLLGKVILVIMVVTLFEGVLEFHADSALDLLLVSGAILLAAGALYVSHRDHTDARH